MKTALVLVAVCLVVVVLFPPTDNVHPATESQRFGDYTAPGRPEMRIGNGFEFITEVGGQDQIRFVQWFTEMGVVGVIGGIVVFLSQNFPRSGARALK